MQTLTHCPHCSQKLRVGTEKLGKLVGCPKCQQSFSIDSSGSASLESIEKAAIRTTEASADSTLGSLSKAPKPASETRRPRKLGRFEVVSLLGAGGFGKVYKAKDPSLDRYVALKVPMLASSGENRISRFLAEAKAAARLRHPNIVTTYESGKAGNQYYIATEYIEGELLSDRLERGSLSFSEAAEIVRKLALALQYAHSRGIIHRDLKPHNVMLDGDGEPQLMDFGLARRTDDDSHLTTDGALLGTPAYMSPEQARGEVPKVDALSDQYSLGVILYYLLTGSTPHSGAPYVIVSKVAMGHYHPVREKTPEVDPTLEAICQKAMMPEREDRYRSCEEFAADLLAWSESRPVLARPMTRLQDWIRHAQRHKVAAGAVAAVTAVIFAGMLIAMFAGKSQPGSLAGDTDVVPQVTTNNTAAGGRGDQATEDAKLSSQATVAVRTGPEFVFADFENGTYGDWTQEGIAFGNNPRSSFSPANRDARFALHPWPMNGKFLADSLCASNGACSGKFTGKLTSPTFTIHQRFINFMGAGRVEYVRLIVDGDVVLTGERDVDTPFDRLAPITMDVNDHLGQTATLEILDDGSAAPDHVTADHFVFSDSDLRQAWLAKCVEDTTKEAIELLGRKYYFGPVAVTLENAKNLAEVVGGRLVTVESDDEATALSQYLKGHTWTGIKNINGVWQSKNGDIYTHVDWAADLKSIGVPSHNATDTNAHLSPEGIYRSVSHWRRYPVIEFGERQKPPSYQLTAPEKNRQLAEFLVDSKAAFILATADRFVFHFNRNDSTLPAEPFEVWTVSLGPGLEVDRQVEQLFNFENKIRHLEIMDGDDDTLKLASYLSELRSLQVKGGNYDTWDGVSEMSPGHPLTKLELRDVAFNAEHISPFFFGKGLNTIYFHSVKLSPEIGDLIATHSHSLVHYWSNVGPGLGRKGFEAIGKCKRLRTAMLWGSDVRDEDLEHLGQIRSLEDVQLGRNPGITGATLDQLAGWQKVHNLEFCFNPITDETLVNLPELPSLRSIDLTSTKIAGSGLARLNDLPSLEFVELNKTFVNDTTILQLKGCKKLNRLTATDTGVTREGLAPLFQRFPGFSADVKAAGSSLVNLTDAEHAVAAWVRSIGGQTFFDQGLQIEIPPSAKVSDTDFERFQDLPNLTSLTVSNGETNFRIAGPPLSDEAILHLKSLPKLRTIVVGGKEITDQSLEHLSSFPIEELTVFKASITNGGLRPFKNHSLKTLSVNGCQQVTDLGLDKEFLGQIETLNLRGTNVTNVALADLIGTHDLRVLTVSDTRMTPAILRIIGNFRSLEVLDAASLKINDKDLSSLSNLQNLKRLYISRNRLTEKGLQLIANNCPLLESFDFGHNQVDASTTIDWTGLQKLKFIYLYPARVNDQQLLAMAEMSNLRKLKFGPIDYATTSLSPEAMQTFANKLPECRIWDATAKEHAERMRNLAAEQ